MHEEKDQKPLKINISVENFGPIEKADIDLRPLTVFVGESNTGKTYLATLIHSLHKSFDGFTQFPSSHRLQSNIAFTYRPVARKVSNQEKLDREIFEILEKLNTHGRPFKFSDLPERVRTMLESDLNRTDSIEEKLRLYYDLETISEIIRSARDSNNVLSFSLNISDVNQTLWSFDMQNNGTGSTAYGLINGDMVINTDNRKSRHEPLDFDEFRRIFRIDRREEKSSHYLPAARSGIMQSHGIITMALYNRTTKVGLELYPEIPTFSGMIVDFLNQIVNYNEVRGLSDKIDFIAKYLETEVLQGRIEINKPAGVSYPEYLYYPKQSEIALRMSQCSSMVSELTPLVLYLRRYVKCGDTLIIEEPEAHLHPRAQTQVAIALSRLVRAGVRVIITTHSDWFLEQISNLVREGELMRMEQKQQDSSTYLTAEEVGAWWFHADKPVEEIKFDLVNGIEPPDYGNVAEDLYNHSVDLRSSLRENAGANTSEQE